MRRLLTISPAKRDLKKALAGASWDCWTAKAWGKTKYINLCQINRKTHFQTPVCTPYSYFILSITIYIYIYIYIFRKIRLSWLISMQKFIKWTCPLVICHEEFTLVEIQYRSQKRCWCTRSQARYKPFGNGNGHLVPRIMLNII